MNFWLLVFTSAVSAGLFANMLGWFQSALKDGKIDKYEWKKGLGTFLSCLVVTIPLVVSGLDPVIAASLSIPVSIVIEVLKKIGTNLSNKE